MKTKNLSQKLAFNKVTISTLNNSAMNGLLGGVETFTCVGCESEHEPCDQTTPTFRLETCGFPYTQCAINCEIP